MTIKAIKKQELKTVVGGMNLFLKTPNGKLVKAPQAGVPGALNAFSRVSGNGVDAPFEVIITP